jgi:hypothetical protein
MNNSEFYYIHPFIYDLELLTSKEDRLKTIDFKDDFLVFFDKLFRDVEKGKTVNVPSKIKVTPEITEYLITVEGNNKFFRFKIIDAEIYFFINDIAFFVLRIKPEDVKNKEELYELNYMLSSFYKFEDKKEVYIVPYKEGLNPSDLDTDKKYIPQNKEFPFIHKNDESSFDESRIGLCKKKEQEKINEILEENPQELHYRNINDILKLAEGRYDFIHYDTFITGFFIDYVKLNRSFFYYDNFNPLGENFLSFYCVVKLSENMLKYEYENNFKKYVPLLDFSKCKGVIKNSDFYHVMQIDSDVFAMGNQNNLIVFINCEDKECSDEIEDLTCPYCIEEDSKSPKRCRENKMLLIFMYVMFQYVSLIMLSTKFVVDYDKEKNIFNRAYLFYKNVNFIYKALKEYSVFLVNHNFSSISDKPMLNNAYRFLRKIKYIEEQLGNIKNIVGSFGSLQNIVKNISKTILMFLAAMFVVLLIFKVLNMASNTVLEAFTGFIKSHILAHLINICNIWK